MKNTPITVSDIDSFQSLLASKSTRANGLCRIYGRSFVNTRENQDRMVTVFDVVKAENKEDLTDVQTYLSLAQAVELYNSFG